MMEEPYTEPIFLKVAGQQEILSQIVDYLMLSDVGKLFSVIQQRQPQRDVVVRTKLTFRPTESLLEGVVFLGLLRLEGDELILPSKSILKSLVIVDIAYGVSWEKMCNLFRFVRSFPLEICNGTKEKIRLKNLDTRVRILGTVATFHNNGMNITLPFRRCLADKDDGQCKKISFRSNKCEINKNPFHRFVMATHCRYHERQLGCGLCLEEEEEEEEDDENECLNCGGEYSLCEHCDEIFCLECDGNFCDVCHDFFCSNCECDCEVEEIS